MDDENQDVATLIKNLNFNTNDFGLIILPWQEDIKKLKELRKAIDSKDIENEINCLKKSGRHAEALSLSSSSTLRTHLMVYFRYQDHVFFTLLKNY